MFETFPLEIMHLILNEIDDKDTRSSAKVRRTSTFFNHAYLSLVSINNQNLESQRLEKIINSMLGENLCNYLIKYCHTDYKSIFNYFTELCDKILDLFEIKKTIVKKLEEEFCPNDDNDRFFDVNIVTNCLDQLDYKIKFLKASIKYFYLLNIDPDVKNLEFDNVFNIFAISYLEKFPEDKFFASILFAFPSQNAHNILYFYDSNFLFPPEKGAGESVIFIEVLSEFKEACHNICALYDIFSDAEKIKFHGQMVDCINFYNHVNCGSIAAVMELIGNSPDLIIKMTHYLENSNKAPIDQFNAFLDMQNVFIVMLSNTEDAPLEMTTVLNEYKDVKNRLIHHFGDKLTLRMESLKQQKRKFDEDDKNVLQVKCRRLN